MKILSDCIKWFMYINTGIMIVTAINFPLAGVDSMPMNTLWNIMFSALVTTVVTVCFCPREERKAKMPLQYIMHYLALCAVMIFFGNMFGWIRLNVWGVLMMMVDVALVYVIAFVVYYILDIRRADIINKKLKEIYGDEE